MKNILIGFILGIVLVFSLGAARNSDYQSTLTNQVGTSNFLYAVLDTHTGDTRLTMINTGPGHLVLKTAVLDKNGRGEW